MIIVSHSAITKSPPAIIPEGCGASVVPACVVIVHVTDDAFIVGLHKLIHVGLVLVAIAAAFLVVFHVVVVL